MCSGAQSFPVTRIGPTRQSRRSLASPSILDQHIAGSGFPHSEISGSKFVRNSPELIAAYHVLHRLSVPRHPPNALKTLDRSHHPCSPHSQGSRQGRADHTTDKTILLRIHPMPARCTPRGQVPRHMPRACPQNPGHNRMNVLFTLSNNPRIRASPATRPSPRQPRTLMSGHQTSPPQTRKLDDPQARKTPPSKWWSQTGSNRRPHACKARALPTELWPLAARPQIG